MTTATDPRERLIHTGNELLDIVYKLTIHERTNAELFAAAKSGSDDRIKAAVAGLSGRTLADAVIGFLELEHKRSDLVARYVLLRETIEQLEQPRDDMRNAGYNQPPRPDAA